MKTGPRPSGPRAGFRLMRLISAASASLIIGMTGKAGENGHCIWMALAAGSASMKNAASPFAAICWPGMGKIKLRRTPTARAMAGGAICSKDARVEGRVGMTTDARGGRPRELGIDVALLANHVLVCAGQREVGFIVIEGHLIPFRRRVAGRAVRAKFAAVSIVLGVTGITVCGRALENFIFMTAIARNFRMCAYELETRKVVVELGGRPAIGRVTRAAVRAEFARVGILLDVARGTVLWSLL